MTPTQAAEIAADLAQIEREKLQRALTADEETAEEARARMTAAERAADDAWVAEREGRGTWPDDDPLTEAELAELFEGEPNGPYDEIEEECTRA